MCVHILSITWYSDTKQLQRLAAYIIHSTSHLAYWVLPPTIISPGSFTIFLVMVLFSIFRNEDAITCNYIHNIFPKTTSYKLRELKYYFKLRNTTQTRCEQDILKCLYQICPLRKIFHCDNQTTDPEQRTSAAR